MSIPDQIFTRAIKEGFTKEAACALLANIQAESAFNPINLEDSKERSVGMNDQTYTDAVDVGWYQNFINDGCGYGLAQWTFWSRKQMLLEFSRERNTSIGSLEMQMEFIFYEMRISFFAIYNSCKSSHDMEYLVHEFLYKWENPDEKVNNMKNRLASANGFYQKYAVWENNEIQEEEKMTVNTAKQKVLSIARAELGYHEQGDNITKYAQEMDQTNWYNGPKQGFPYCDVFVDWLFYKAFGSDIGRQMICQPTKSAGAGCLYSAQYYKQAGRWYQVPEVGDQIFFTYSPGEYSHTGIVEKIENGIVTTIEGNTSDQVARRQYTSGSSQIAGYGRPKWELVEENTVPTGNTSTVMLQRGMAGWDVENMQKKLYKLGFYLGSDGIDGEFGTMTESAVRDFQKKYNLEVDGIAGPETLKKLEELCKDESSAENQNESKVDPEDEPRKVGVTKLSNGDKGNMVKLAQACLYHLAYEISIDGIFGDVFEKKIKEFQEADGLEPTGVINKSTWMKLLEIPYRGGGGSVR